MNKNCLNCLYFGGVKGAGYYCNQRNKLYLSVAACGYWRQHPERTTEPQPELIIRKALMETAMYGIISHDEYQRAMNWMHELTTPAEGAGVPHETD